jgi:hypothetical protein
MTPRGLRVQYLIPNLSPKRECLSIHSSLPLGPRHHAISRNQRKQSLCRTEANCRPQAPLPNLLKETFLLPDGFFHQAGPQIRLLPVPNFGVNRKDPATRSMRGRGRGGEQAATRSRDPSAPAVRRSVANLGFEFMVCRSKNVLYNSVNAFYQLGNNCKNNYNAVIR